LHVLVKQLFSYLSQYGANYLVFDKSTNIKDQIT
jgi:hypothetical protein